MKIRTISFYGDHPLGAVIEVNDAEGERMIEVKGAIAYVPTEAEAAADAEAASTVKKSTR